MSYTEIYKFKKDGDAECVATVKNAFRGGMAIWLIVEKRYLPKYVPTWATMLGDTSKEYSRISDFSGNGSKEIWSLFDSEIISETDNIVLGSTFDNVVVMKEDIPKLIEAFRNFEGETSLREQADIIEDVYQNDEDLLAIAWNQTPVNGDVWVSDETDDDGEHLPYNLLRDEGHWDLFEQEI